jgi:hypothetical protein
MTEEEAAVSIQLFLAGQLFGTLMRTGSPREIKDLVKQIDPDALQGFLDSKPEGFLYTELVQQTIRLARTFKSMAGKG